VRSSLRLGSLVAFLIATPALLLAQRQTRMIYLNVVDQAGAPVLDLKTPDFEVREGTDKRTVTSAALSNGPMRIMLCGSASEGFELTKCRSRAQRSADWPRTTVATTRRTLRSVDVDA